MDQPALLPPLTQPQQRMRHLCAAYESGASPIVVPAGKHVPFGQIIGTLHLPTDRSRTEVLQTTVTLHTEQGPGVRLEPFIVGSPQVLHDVVLDAWRDAAGISLAFRCGTSLFTAGTIAAMARGFEAVPRAAVADPDARLSALEVPH